MKVPANCDGYGAASSLGHALDCKKRGLVTQCHNKGTDVIGDNLAEDVPSLIADLSIRGVWQPQTVGLFNVLDTDTGAPSHSRVVTAIFSSAKEEKKENTLKQQLFAEPSCCIS